MWQYVPNLERHNVVLHHTTLPAMVIALPSLGKSKRAPKAPPVPPKPKQLVVQRDIQCNLELEPLPEDPVKVAQDAFSYNHGLHELSNYRKLLDGQGGCGLK
jgi:hypothetical protein